MPLNFALLIMRFSSLKGIVAPHLKGVVMNGILKFVRGWLVFSVLWGVFMWFMSWQAQGKEIGMAIVMSLYAGLIYQALATMIARYKARKQQA